MGWIGRAFGRALIYNGVRDVFYAGRQAQQQRGSTSRRQLAKQGDVALIVVSYKCVSGHVFNLRFNRPVDEHDETARCPECGKLAIWRSIDVHRENPGVA